MPLEKNLPCAVVIKTEEVGVGSERRRLSADRTESRSVGLLGLACVHRCRLMSGCRRCIVFPTYTFLLILTIGVCFFFSVKDNVVIENQTRQQ